MAGENNSPNPDDGTPADGGGLSVKKMAFAIAYHQEKNATKAAILAGYSARTAQQQGSRLLKDPAIRAELARLAAEQVESDSTPAVPQEPPRTAKGTRHTRPVAPKPAATPPAPPEKFSESLLARQPAADLSQPIPATTPMEESFITEYLRNGMNGTAAWIFTHPGCSPDLAASYASALIRKPRVAERIASERRRLAQQHEMTRDQLLAEFLAIVRANPNELTQMRCVACSTCWPGEERKGRWVDPDPECPECMGEGNTVPWFADTRKLSPEALALFAGVKLTNSGVTILQHDKMTALVNIGKILGAYEKDNAQKRPELSEAIAAFVGELHQQGAGRLPFAHRPQPSNKVQH